jgi:hypothetical protein
MATNRVGHGIDAPNHLPSQTTSTSSSRPSATLLSELTYDHRASSNLPCFSSRCTRTELAEGGIVGKCDRKARSDGTLR